MNITPVITDKIQPTNEYTKNSNDNENMETEVFEPKQEYNVDKSSLISYKDIRLNETKSVPTDNILELLKDTGGYREQEYISNLKENIKKEGIKTPIEISIGSDGQYQIDNGKHRLQIAKELGMDKVPVKLVESWSDIVSRKENKEAKGNDGTTNNNNVLDEKSRGSSRMPRGGNELLGNGRATTKDVELFDGKSDSIEQRSGIQDDRNNRETIKNSEQGSFSLSKDSKGRTLSREQQEYFKDSKIRDENGNLLEVYHGSNTDNITIFELDKTSEDNVFRKRILFYKRRTLMIVLQILYLQ